MVAQKAFEIPAGLLSPIEAYEILHWSMLCPNIAAEAANLWNEIGGAHLRTPDTVMHMKQRSFDSQFRGLEVWIILESLPCSAGTVSSVDCLPALLGETIMRCVELRFWDENGFSVAWQHEPYSRATLVLNNVVPRIGIIHDENLAAEIGPLKFP